MDNANIRKLLGLLHRSPTPENRAFVDKKLADAGFTITDLYQNMEMEEPYSEAHRAEALPPVSTPVHTHPFGELICCTSSSGAEFQLDGQRFRIQRGDVILIPAGVPHALFAGEDSGQRYSGIILWISTEYSRMLTQAFPNLRLSEDVPLTGGVLRTGETPWEGVAELFRGIAAEFESRTPGWEAAVSGMITLLMSQLGRAAADLGAVPRTGEKPELLDSILSYVEARLAHKITLEDTAKRFWVSQSTITHLFHEKMGVSFYKYVTRRRLAESQNLMLEGMALEKVAAKVGFGDYSAFYRAFKAEFGISPREFRNRKYAE